jgi:3-methyladenine DNA glycosylase AlkD
MPKRKPHTPAVPTGTVPTAAEVHRWLAAHGSRKQIEAHARYGIAAARPYGVAMGQLKAYARQIGRDHALARALWSSGRYEARLLAAFVDEPEHVTLSQMRDWIQDCDNWALVDTLCFALFDRTPSAWKPIAGWARSPEEFVRRAAFAQLWALALHDKAAPDAGFERGLALIEGCAGDERNFVWKAVDMALRAIGRRNPALRERARATAERLCEREEACARRIGRHALRALPHGRARA